MIPRSCRGGNFTQPRVHLFDHPYTQHMTLKHEDLARSIVLRDHEGEDVPYDIFLNSNRADELRNSIDVINKRLEDEKEFWQTGINEAEASRLVLGILWMSVFQCNELIVSNIGFQLEVLRFHILLIRILCRKMAENPTPDPAPGS